MTSELMSCQLELDFVTEEEFQEIAYMEEFGSFLCPWFFKSSLAADSPINDLDIVDDVRKVQDSSSDDPKVVIAAERA